jgi:hypothetical protein
VVSLEGSGDDKEDSESKQSGTTVFDASGSLLRPHDSESLSTTMWTIVKEAFVHSNDHCISIDPATSLHDFFVSCLPVHVPDTAPDAVTRRARIMQIADF